MKHFLRRISSGMMMTAVKNAETAVAATKESPFDRAAPGHRCDHPGCAIRFQTKRERLKHLLKDHHCTKCGWGHNLSYSFGAVVPDVFLKQHGYCKACTFESMPMCVEDEKGVYVEN